MGDDPIGSRCGAAQVLDILGICRRAGKIQIVVDADAYAVHVSQGRILYATSTQRSLRLGHLLLQRGAVQPLYLHDVLKGRRTISRDAALGSVLVRDGAITLEDLAAGVEEQATEILARVLALDGATFVFSGEEPVPIGIEIVPLSVEKLMTNADRRVVERISQRLMQRLLPRRDERLRLSAQLALVSYLLTDAELLVALNVDRGNVTVELLEQSVQLAPLKLRRTIISLLERGYLSLADASPSGNFG
jgi:hypothetical protein